MKLDGVEFEVFSKNSDYGQLLYDLSQQSAGEIYWAFPTYVKEIYDKYFWWQGVALKLYPNPVAIDFHIACKNDSGYYTIAFRSENAQFYITPRHNYMIVDC